MSRKARAEAPSIVKAIRISPEELDRVERAVRVSRQEFAQFHRDALLNHADEYLDRTSQKHS